MRNAATIALVLLAVTAVATEPFGRPRIGLCLAGGGARGGAHIGVLKVLEEHRIPIDCIAGTSIGSIIGGLYASGMSPADMDSAVLSLDWERLFHDSPPRQLVNFRRKEEDRIPYFDLEFGVGKSGFKLPAGLIAGQKLQFLLRELTLPTIGIEDFDQLTIPFRAVAADLDDGSVVVLGSGTLADAMRASMAIPGAFTPHVVDGRILVDGGIVRNVPYDVVKNLGADVVIVVDVGMPPGELGHDPTILGVLYQTVSVGTTANAVVSVGEMADEDLLLVPDLDGIGVESFGRMAEASQRGEAEARASAGWLAALSLPEAEYEAWRSRHRAGRDLPPVQVAEVRVDVPGRIDPRRVAQRVESPDHAPLDLAVLSEDLSRVFRIGEFELVDYSLEPRQSPEPNQEAPGRDLVIHTRDKRWGPNYLRTGLAFVGHLDGRAEFAAFLYHRLAAINHLGAEWRNQASVGDRLGLASEFYQPLTLSGRLFAAPSAEIRVEKRQRYLTFDLSELVDSERLEGAFDVGVNMSHWGELRLGAYTGSATSTSQGTMVDFTEDETLGGWRGHLTFDQLDDIDFPRRGWALEIEGKLSRTGLGATTPYDRLLARVHGAVTTGRTTVNGHIEAGTSFGDDLPFHDRFELGGFTRLSAFERGRVFGDQMMLVRAGAFWRLWSASYPLSTDIFAGFAGEAGQAWDHTDEPALDDIILGGTVFVGANTLLGPFYLGYGFAEGGHDSLYLIFGRAF